MWEDALLLHWMWATCGVYANCIARDLFYCYVMFLWIPLNSLQIFEEKCDSGENFHLAWCKVKDFLALMTYIYTNRCENIETVKELYQKLTILCREDQSDGGLGLVDSLPLDHDTNASIIVHDTPVTSLNGSAQALSDDDLFSSFTFKPRDSKLTNVSRDSDDDVSAESRHDVICSTLPSHCDVTANLDQSDDDIMEINQSDCVFVAADSAQNSTPRSQEWVSPEVRSQPCRESGRVHFDDVTLSLPVDAELDVDDSLLLHTALRIDEHKKFKTPTGREGKVPITPMPDFSAMETPEIINRVKSSKCWNSR